MPKRKPLAERMIDLADRNDLPDDAPLRLAAHHLEDRIAVFNGDTSTFHDLYLLLKARYRAHQQYNDARRLLE